MAGYLNVLNAILPKLGMLSLCRSFLRLPLTSQVRENVAVGSAQFLLHSILEFMADKVPEKN